MQLNGTDGVFIAPYEVIAIHMRMRVREQRTPCFSCSLLQLYRGKISDVKDGKYLPGQYKYAFLSADNKLQQDALALEFGEEELRR